MDSLYMEESANPLDGAEDILNDQNFAFNRAGQDELFVEAKGQFGQYNMMFIWDENMAALQFCCEYNLAIADMNRMMAFETIMGINSKLWLGHFDLPHETLVPTFRYTQLFRGAGESSGADTVQELMKIAIEQCDRHFSAFMTLSHDEYADENQLAFALLLPAGQA